MGLEQEGLGRSEIKIKKLLTAEAGLKVNSGIGEVRMLLSKEPKAQKTTNNGFEPFTNGGKNGEDNLFINLYGGNFSKAMQLDREKVEKVLKIAHLDGQVFLASLAFSRDRSSEIQDNEVAIKRFLFFGEKTQEDNPLYRVISVPEGWRIEINDGKIMEDLNQERLTGEKLQREFIKKFNRLLNKSLFECILKEKMTNTKDEDFVTKVLPAVVNSAFGISISASKLPQLNLSDIALAISVYFSMNVAINLLSLSHDSRIKSPYPYARKLDAGWEYLMPAVEVDKVLRSFLWLKSRKLVREAKP